MLKKASLYVTILITWLLLFLIFTPFAIREYVFSGTRNTTLDILIALNAIFIIYFWLNGTKDIIYVLWFYLHKKSITQYVQKVSCMPIPANKRIVMLYCTCNDFEGDSLTQCLKQKYAGSVKTVILDDSSDPNYKNKVDEYAKEHNVEVVRRENRKGFKAGNLNNYLHGRTDYDYFVILDSDEIIPSDFIIRCLQYFQYFKNAGIVQCNHVATRNINRFMHLLHIGVNSHWPVYQTMKHHYGFMSLLGHGAMVSRECYEAVDGLPEVVAEDLCLSIEARSKGYYVAFAPNITCEEQYPIDYLAFKKRHSKWTQGNFEFMKCYTKRIFTSKMRWFEKLDIFLFTYNLPLTSLFTCYVAMNIIFFPALHYDLHYPAWLLVPTVIFFMAPMLNDVFFWLGKVSLKHLLLYMLFTFCLYGSMLYVSMKSSFLALTGRKAIFVVTPKTTQHITLAESLRMNIQEIIFSIVLITLSCAFKGGILPVILIVAPTLFSIYLTMYSNSKKPIDTPHHARNKYKTRRPLAHAYRRYKPTKNNRHYRKW
ncbi:glycosyltransferase [Gardnerella vaginalis]|nr:glycosyltransferase [Gardnerella vaginalis]